MQLGKYKLDRKMYDMLKNSRDFYSVESENIFDEIEVIFYDEEDVDFIKYRNINDNKEFWIELYCFERIYKFKE